MQHLTVSLVQSPLFWEDRERNLEMFTKKLQDVEPSTELVVLPEMFTTGFTMQPKGVAESMEGRSMQWMQDLASAGGFVISGSMIIEENGAFYNRLIWMPPDGNYAFYDKKHLFTHAGEDKNYVPGSSRKIFLLKNWKIMPMICYDLRFPVWSRNKHAGEHGFDFDCMLNVANWPASRSHAWRVLLMARAIENQCYVIGLNRLGKDGNGIDYSGDSAVIDPLGENISTLMPHEERVEKVVMTRCSLDGFRDTFRPWADWDSFTLI